MKESKEFKSQIRVIYADIDKMGIVYYGKYFEYFEYARGEALRDIGFPYKLLEENNLYLPVIESHLEYFLPAKYDDFLTIHTKIYYDENKRSRLKLQCETYLNQKLLNRGYTIHVFVNESAKPLRLKNNILIKALFEKLFN